MHSKVFIPLLSALSLSRLASAQDGRVPLGAVTGTVVTCGGCYAVAGVAGIFFGTETITLTQTNSMIMVGNSTTVFTTGIPFDSDSFTIAEPSGVISPAPTAIPAAVTSFDIDGTAVTIGGQTLTGPDPVNVFTAYSTTRTMIGTDGVCRVIAGSSITVSPAFTVHIPPSITDASGFSSFQLIAEQSFFNQLDYPKDCSGAGVSLLITSRVPVTVVTTEITTTASNLTVAPATISTTSATPTSTPVTTTSSPSGEIIGTLFSSAPNVTFFTLSSGQSVITINPTAGITSVATEINTVPGATIVPGAANANRPSALSALLSGALAMVMGLVA